MFRFGISDLFLHYYRYRKHSVTDLVCPLCKSNEENEIHFVFCCPALDDLWHQLIPRKYCRRPSQSRLSLLMASTNETIIKQFAVYLYRAFKIRSIACS